MYSTRELPGICFDANGVCSYCANHVNQVTFGEDKLLRLLDKYRRNDGSYDCLVGLAAGIVHMEFTCSKEIWDEPTRLYL